MKVPQFFYHFLTEGTWQRIVDVANALAPSMATHFGEGRTGGVITLYSYDDGRRFGVHAQAEAGTPDPGKLGKYYVISLEKPVRAVRLGTENSWVADRDPELLQYGGAFKIPRLPLYLSFSGWKEQDDIVFATYVLWRAAVIRREDVDEVFRRHDGITLELMERWEYFEDVFEAVPV